MPGTGGIGLGDPTSSGIGWRPCSELLASDFLWHVDGFEERDIAEHLNVAEVVVEVPVGQTRSLRLSTRSHKTTASCTEKAQRVEWLLSDLSVVRVAGGSAAGTFTLTMVRPGETTLSARITFGDGSAPVEATVRVSVGLLEPQTYTVRILRARS